MQTISIPSYRREMLDAGYGAIDDPRSAFYSGADSWLLDYDGLLNCFADSFGPDQITALDDDQTVSRDGTILPVMLEAMGVPAFESPERDFIWLNTGSDKSF